MKIRTLIITAMLTIVAFFTTTASAKEVDRSLAGNPSAVLSEINGMNLPTLSDQEAGKIRGENWALIGQYIYWGASRIAVVIGGRPTPVVPIASATWTSLMYWWNNGGSTGGGGSW
jgi:hypothetical protein